MAISGRSFQKVVAGARMPQEVTINNFNGVDLSSPTFQINGSRAASSINFLKKDDINQKREGFENVLTLETATANQIKGVFSFTDSTGVKRVVCVLNSTIYLITGLGSGNDYVDASYTFTALNNSANTAVTFATSEKFVSGWVAGDRLYLLFPGTDYVVVYYNADAVDGARVVVDSLPNNKDLTYIPLTRFGSTAIGTGIAYEAGIAYDDLNMLTQWKKNNFRTGVFANIANDNPFHTDEFFRYTLDSKISSLNNSADLSQIRLKIKYLETTATNLLSLQSWNSTYANTLILDPNGPIPKVEIANTYKKAAYTTAGVGQDFLSSDIVFKLNFDPGFSSYPFGYKIPATSAWQTLDTFIHNSVNTLVVYDVATYPLGTYAYPMQATSATRAVIDLRQAVVNGYISHHIPTANGHHSFKILKGDFGGFSVNLSLWVVSTTTSSNTSGVFNKTCSIAVVTPNEYSVYEVEKELDLLPSNVGNDVAVFTTLVGGLDKVVANLYFGSDTENAYLQIPYNDTGSPGSFLHALSLSDFYSPTIGFSNMEILFPFYVEGYTSRVTNNKFGKLFGYNGSKNRLFLGGNPEFKNVLYHTYNTNFYTQGQGEIVPTNSDLTYFSDLEYNIIGSEDNAITGLEVLSDNKLLVLKMDNKEDSTIHTITATTIKATAYDGSSVTALDGTDLQEELYLADTGNIGDGLEHHWLIATLNGDTMFLSKSGVRGVVAERNLPTSPRKSVSRSSVINRILRQSYTEIDEAAMTVHNGRLYVFLDGTIYVADEDYKAEAGQDFEYEWWILKSKEVTNNNVKSFEDIDLKNFFEFDGELYFYDNGSQLLDGTYRNRIYKLVDGSYVDKKIDRYANGYITYNTSTTGPGDTTISDVVGPPVVITNLSTDKYVSFKYQTYHLLGDATINTTTNRIDFNNVNKIPALTLNEIAEGREVVVVKGGSASFTNTYYFYDVDEYSTQLKDSNGNIITNWTNFETAGYVTFGAPIKPGKELKVNSINGATFEFTLMFDYDVLTRFTFIEAQTPNREFFVIDKPNVTAQYITAPFNFGSISDLKTITKFIISNDTRQDSFVQIEYLASNDTDMFKTITNTNTELNLSNMSFNTIYFGSVNLPLPFSVRTNMRNVQSVMFKFYNNEDNNACITNLTMLYYMTRKVR